MSGQVSDPGSGGESRGEEPLSEINWAWWLKVGPKERREFRGRQGSGEAEGWGSHDGSRKSTSSSRGRKRNVLRQRRSGPWKAGGRGTLR